MMIDQTAMRGILILDTNDDHDDLRAGPVMTTELGNSMGIDLSEYEFEIDSVLEVDNITNPNWTVKEPFTYVKLENKLILSYSYDPRKIKITFIAGKKFIRREKLNTLLDES